MSLSIQKLVSDGTLSTIVLGVQYLQRNDIYLRIAGVDTPQSGAPSGYTWSFVDNSTLRILPVVPVGVEVTVYRRTDFDSMYNVYSQNAQFDESTIDENNQQLLYIAQEYFEQGIPGASIEVLEYVRATDDGYYYRFKLTDGSYTPEFLVPISPNTKLANRAMWTRFAAESGYVLAAGDFETGGVLLNNKQVLLDESTQGIYSWSGAYPVGGKVVAAGTVPTVVGSGYVPRTDLVLRDELAGSAGTLMIGRGARTLSDRLDASPHVKDYSTLADALAAGSGRLVFEPGTYIVSDNTVISRHCVIHKGATVIVAAGKKLTFTGQVEAGNYKIFSHGVNLLSNYTAAAPVIIKGCAVKAAWFADYTNIADGILTITDQTNNLMVAARAAFGDWIADGANFISSIPSGVLKFCGGYWRCDGEFAPSKQYSVDSKFYKLNGGTIKGESAGASYLVRTALSSTDVVFKVGYYTGELTNVNGLKVVAYNPSGRTPAERFSSSSKCMAYFQGDSLTLSNFWVAGANVSDRVDARGCYRNGVGIQFVSCIDTHISNVFVEYCVTGIGVSSSQITASGVTLFNTLHTAIGIGNFLTEWPDAQAGYSSIQMDNVLAANLANNAITTLETGALSNVQISGLFDGYNTENSTQTGTEMVRVSPGTRLRGSMSGEFKNWNSKLISVKSQAWLGDEGNSFRLHNFSLKNLFGIGAVVALASDALCVATVSNGSILDCYGALFEGNSRTITLSDLSLSNFGGHIDGSANRSLFAVGSGTLNMERVYRNSLDVEALNMYGYASPGSVVKIDCNIANATRAVYGGGAATMPQYVTFS